MTASPIAATVAPAVALAEALAARLCHDLAGPAGTLGGLLDLLAEEAPPPEWPDANALDLAREAAAALRRRLHLTRAAWGSAAQWQEAAWPGLVAGLTTPHLRVAFDEAALHRGRSAAMGRLLLNAALLGGSALRERGTIALRAESGGAIRIALGRAGGPVAWPALTPPPPPEPAHIQALWTLMAASAARATLRPDGAILHIAPI